MALLSYALTTVSRYKTFAGVSGSANDTLFEILINQATTFIENYCGRRFMQTLYTGVLVDSDGGEAIHLPEYPISTTAGLTLYERVTLANEDDWAEVDTKDYYIDYNAGILFLVNHENWLEGRQRYKVDFTAGYDFDNTTKFLSDSLAGDVELVVWKLVKTSFDRRAGEVGIKSEQIADYSVTYSESIYESKELKDILDNYKKESVIGGGAAILY